MSVKKSDAPLPCLHKYIALTERNENPTFYSLFSSPVVTWIFLLEISIVSEVRNGNIHNIKWICKACIFGIVHYGPATTKYTA